MAGCSHEWKDLPLLDRSMSLAGDWELRFDPKDIGLESGGMLPSAWSDQSKIYQIKVPGVWESIQEGVGYDGVAWYRRSIRIPAAPKGRKLYLAFGAVDESARVYVNGVKVGEHDQGEYEKAVDLYNRSLKMFEDLGDKSGIASTLHHLGMIHHDQGEYEKAVELYNKSLKIKEELGDKSGIAITLGQIGMIYESKENFKEALTNYLIALNIFEFLKSPL